MKECCEGHVPQRSDTCPIHKNLRWAELHDNELTLDYKTDAIFYCRVLGCDAFDWHVRLGFGKWPWLNTAGTKDSQIFSNTVRLKILFHKLSMREGDEK